MTISFHWVHFPSQTITSQQSAVSGQWPQSTTADTSLSMLGTYSYLSTSNIYLKVRNSRSNFQPPTSPAEHHRQQIISTYQPRLLLDQQSAMTTPTPTDCDDNGNASWKNFCSGSMNYRSIGGKNTANSIHSYNTWYAVLAVNAIGCLIGCKCYSIIIEIVVEILN